MEVRKIRRLGMHKAGVLKGYERLVINDYPRL